MYKNKERFLKFVQDILLPLLIFIFITFIIHPTLFTGFSTMIERHDGRLLAWTMSWNSHKLLTNPSEVFDANIFYPNENTLTYSEHLLGSSYLYMPAYIIFNRNPAAVFNFVMILSYVLNAFFAYWLCKYLTRNKLAGLIGGIVFGYCSYRILNLGHLQNMIIFYIPLMTFFLFKYFEEKRSRYLILVGLMLLLQSLTSWYHMIFIFMLFALLLTYFFWIRKVDKKDIVKIIFIHIPVMLIILPFALPYIKFNSDSGSAYTINDVKAFSSDIGGYLFPSPNTLLNKILDNVRITKTSWAENFNYIGILPFILSLIAILKINISKEGINIAFKKSRIKYFLIGIIFVLFSFGPFLRVDDVTTKIPMPYYIIYHLLPQIRFMRAVARFATVAYLMLGILSAFGFLDLVKNKQKRITYFLFLIFCAVILIDYYPFSRVEKYVDVSKTPEIYTHIRNNDSVKAIVEMPIDVNTSIATGSVYYAGIHFKPMLNGYSGYEPETYGQYKKVLTNDLNGEGYRLLKEIGITHLVNLPTSSIIPDNKFFKKIFEKEGYVLYEVI